MGRHRVENSGRGAASAKESLACCSWDIAVGTRNCNLGPSATTIRGNAKGKVEHKWKVLRLRCADRSPDRECGTSPFRMSTGSYDLAVVHWIYRKKVPFLSESTAELRTRVHNSFFDHLTVTASRVTDKYDTERTTPSPGQGTVRTVFIVDSLHCSTIQNLALQKE